MSRCIELDKAMERIEQIYKDIGVDTYGVWNKQLAEILHFADVEDVRLVLHKIIGAVTQAPSIDIVHCHECKRLKDCRGDSWQTSVINMGYIGWCNRTSRLGDVDYVKEYDFCSYGERKTDE